MTDPAELLAQLRDIHEPAAPEASSALVLGLLILAAVLVFIAVLSLLLWQRRALNRSIRSDIHRVKTGFTTKDNSAIHELAVILRRTMHHLHGDSINQLDNERWLAQLDATFTTRYFSEGRGAIFGTALYHTQLSDADELDQLCNDLDYLLTKVSLRPVLQ